MKQTASSPESNDGERKRLDGYASSELTKTQRCRAGCLVGTERQMFFELIVELLPGASKKVSNTAQRTKKTTRPLQIVSSEQLQNSPPLLSVINLLLLRAEVEKESLIAFQIKPEKILSTKNAFRYFIVFFFDKSEEKAGSVFFSRPGKFMYLALFS